MEVEKGRACDTLVKYQERELNKGLAVEIKLRNELNISEQQLVTQSEATGFARASEQEWRNRFENQKAITKQEKRQKNKWKVATGFTILVIIGQMVFGG